MLCPGSLRNVGEKPHLSRGQRSDFPKQIPFCLIESRSRKLPGWASAFGDDRERLVSICQDAPSCPKGGAVGRQGDFFPTTRPPADVSEDFCTVDDSTDRPPIIVEPVC
jgi:hypothetical protein